MPEGAPGLFCRLRLAELSYQRAPSMPGNAGWRWKAGAYRHTIGFSISKFLPLEGLAER
jgi:hypothetical protein